MGQAVTVANASGGKVYVKVRSSIEVSEKAEFVVTGSASAPSASTLPDGSATGRIDVAVSMLSSV